MTARLAALLARRSGPDGFLLGLGTAAVIFPTFVLIGMRCFG